MSKSRLLLPAAAVATVALVAGGTAWATTRPPAKPAAVSATATTSETPDASRTPDASETAAAAPSRATPARTRTRTASTPSAAAGWVDAPNPVTGVKPSAKAPAHKMFREFQANCAVSRGNLRDDPIVFPKMPGASHFHTFMGNTTTDADTTPGSLSKGQTKCLAPGDLSAYWMPTLLNDGQAVNPEGVQTIYYKTGVRDYTSVIPFPTGLRFVVGSPTATEEEFYGSRGTVEGFECGDDYKNATIPATCRTGTRLNVRYQAPSCWDGKHLDSPDHKAHMSYPVTREGVCPESHPVAVPMLEFKMAWPVSGDMSKVRFSSDKQGKPAGPSFHYDFFNAWDPATLDALVKACINGGRQCSARGYDEREPESTAVLGRDYRLK
jgi:hypothetical protein